VHGLLLKNYKHGTFLAAGGLAPFGLGESYGYIDNFGIEVMPPSFEDACVFLRAWPL
jgi:hypothetical protein